MAKAKDTTGYSLPVVTFTQDCTVYFHNHLLKFTANQKAHGQLAEYLLKTGAPVEVIDNVGDKSK
jgi:hypothetical protein